ncbi:MAG: hypothetical protein J6S67_07680, partial [Methanobrevibacter sp.]|nr:hypothetical protein [Methanobrevibacter sp.]
MSISDLTNTTWVFNNALTALASEDWIEFNINFVSNSTSYNSLGLDDDQQEVMKYVYYDNALETVTAYQPSGAGYTWTNDAYKTITITGGTDAVSSSAKFTTLLSWLEANATRRTFATLNLTTLNLGPGHHLIQAKSKANGFVTSEFNAQNIYYDVYQQLDTPVCTLTGTILSWAGISNADGYTLYAKQSGTTVETVSDIVASMRAYDLTQLELASGTYDIQLQAMGSGYYTDSNLSTAVSYNAMPQLGQVVNVSASGDDVSFDEVEHAERYEFVVDGTTSIGTYTPPAPIYKFHYGTQAYSYDNTSVSIDGISY